MDYTDVNLEVRELEKLIGLIEGVGDVVVISVQQPAGGQVLKAFIEPEDNHQLSEETIINHCLSQSNHGQAPSTVVFCTIPRTPSGKVARQLLLDQCAI